MKKVVFGLGALALVIACGGSDISAAPVTADQACTDADKVLCDKINSCAPLLVQSEYGDSATCQSRTKLGCTPSFSAPGTSATPANLESCAKDAANLSCADLVNNNPPASCKTKPGTVMNGGACGTDAQCAGGYCIIDANTGCGTCGTRIAAGGACDKPGQAACDYGTECIGGTCKAPGNTGDKCAANADCGFGLVCKSMACAPGDAAGAACTTNLMNGDNNCDSTKGLYCAPKTMQCTAVKTAMVGGACGFNVMAGDYTVCVGSFCKPGAMGLQGTCTAYVADGGMCSPTDSCQAPAKCIGNVCKLVDPSTCK